MTILRVPVTAAPGQSGLATWVRAVANAVNQIASETESGIGDGDKGDIVVSSSGTVWEFDTSVVSAFARTILDDTTAADVRSTIGAQAEDAQLTDLAGLAFTGNANKVIAVKADESGFELVTGGAGGTTTNALTINNGGAGAASGATFDGSSPVTISYNTVGAQPLDTDLTAIAGLTLAQGDILYRNGSQLTNLAAGTAGQVLKTQGAGANPVWAGPTVIGSTTTLTSGALELTGLSLANYSKIIIVFEDLTAAAAVRPIVTFSVAASFIGGTSYDFYSRTGAASGTTQDETGSGVAAIQLCDALSNAFATDTSHSFQGEMRVFNPGGTSFHKQFDFDIHNGQGTTGVNVWTEGGGRFKNTGAIDGIRVTGNGAVSLTGGRMTLYGWLRA